MTFFDIRPAISADANQVGEILSAFSDEYSWIPRVHSLKEFIEFAHDMIECNWVMIGQINGTVIGFSALHYQTIHSLYLHKSMRRQGIGSAFLKQMKNNNSRLIAWTFEANQKATNFYLKNGFIEINRTNGENNDEKLPDIQFEWREKFENSMI